MNWYVAHVIMVVRFPRGPQKRFPVWENVVLVRAASEEEAFSKAEAAGRAAAGDDGGTFRWEGKAARWELAGVRKIVECSLASSNPSDGDELTYNELEFESALAVERFAGGLSATGRFDEYLRDTEDEAMPVAKPRRKQA